jgi:hypothetical protein
MYQCFGSTSFNAFFFKWCKHLLTCIVRGSRLSQELSHVESSVNFLMMSQLRSPVQTAAMMMMGEIQNTSPVMMVHRQTRMVQVPLTIMKGTDHYMIFLPFKIFKCKLTGKQICTTCFL